MLTLRDGVRQATRSDHAEVDAAYAGFDLSQRAGYRAFLEAHRQAYWRLAPSWGVEDRADFDALADALDADLQDLTARPERPPPIPLLDGRAVGYVIRGSRLGAALLTRRIGPGLPDRYMRHRMTLSWSEFVRRVNATAHDSAFVADARSAFAAFIPRDMNQ